MLAAYKGRLKVCGLLVATKAGVKLRGRSRHTALDLATARGDAAVVDFLRRAGSTSA